MVEPEGFAEWYALYPRKKARHAAARAYGKVVPVQISAEALIERTKRYDANWTRRPKAELQYCPYPATWLNRGEFLDDAPDRTGGASEQQDAIPPPTRSADEFTDADWLERLELHQLGQPWPERHWGPAPGQLGCRVPPKLLMSAASAAKVTGSEDADDQEEVDAA